jgi:hypothetical protein
MTYSVSCVRDDKHGERFIIDIIRHHQLETKGRPFAEAEVRVKMKELGLPEVTIEDQIRQARKVCISY